MSRCGNEYRLGGVRELTVGIVQHKPGDIENLASLVDRARDATLLLLPEYSNGLPGEKTISLHDWVDVLTGIADEQDSVVVAGVLEESGHCRYSSVVLVRPGGEWSIVYRKRILYRALGVNESRYLCPGSSRPVVMDVNGFKVSFVVCYELRIPEVVREAVAEGAELVVAPSAWYPGPMKEDHLRIVAAARALDNTVWVAVPNQPAPRFTGRSLLIDPWGAIRLQLPPGPGYAETVIDADEVIKARELLPVLRDALSFTGGRQRGS